MRLAGRMWERISLAWAALMHKVAGQPPRLPAHGADAGLGPSMPERQDHHASHDLELRG